MHDACTKAYVLFVTVLDCLVAVVRAGRRVHWRVGRFWSAIPAGWTHTACRTTLATTMSMPCSGARTTASGAYNITHIVVDVNEIERDHVDIRAINALAYRVASNGRCVALWPSGYSSSK